MTISITHGISQHKFFIIAQPKRFYEEPRRDPDHKPIIILTDPKSKKIEQAELHGICTVPICEFHHHNMLCLAAYGSDAETVKKGLLEKYSEELHEDPTVEFWLLKKI
jgi:hypothetical protein